MNTSAERLRDPQQRTERATRILDTAADLLLSHGYRRVTMDDVADGVGIGKGTVYLHWKTREQLFSAVFAREVLCAMDELRQALQQAPRACLLHNFARAYFLAITNRPLLRGFLLEDPHLLGKLTSSPDTARDQRHAAMARDYLNLLAERGLLRDDVSVDEIGYAYQATFEGFLRAEDTAPDTALKGGPGGGASGGPGGGAGEGSGGGPRDSSDGGPGSSPSNGPASGLEQRADLLARTIQRAFENDSAIPDATLRDVSAATVALLTDLIDADRAASGLPES
ncbi:TetR/AcrR family transcriptional regulator [Nonomuraea zeae]|uniref:TetR/AcrR family transcriptional regulator n=1 Tax=Nonomuraea zeae TaxID=1642303 RepID=A0A5S4GMI6_9ACTN|nr:TetR/AcrR family transcriptional regulator [Nonomuraea zeae]TMR27550.1 TetR/AcrR family transcriptional regulator [Nonomuraea zeae]